MKHRMPAEGKRQKQKALNFYSAVILGPTDWQTRCQIAAMLLDRSRGLLSSELQQCVPEQLADEIPALMSNHVSTEQSMRQIKNPALFVADF